MSTLNVDKVDPSTGTALELGTSGDTVTVPTGAGLTVTDEVKTNKISPATGTAFALGDSGDTFTVPSGATIVNSGTATGFGINQTSFLPTAAPLIINGDMQIAQRATSKTGVTNGDFGIWTCDRINFTESGTMSAVIDITQEALTSGNAYTDGFSNAYKIDVTTADASLAADDFYRTNYRIEGQDLQVFKKGTANAEKFTLAFWVKATKTGTNIVELNDNDNGRHCCAAYTIDTTNTWEHKVLNFAADTTGVWGNDNAESLRINFILGAGSNYTSGTLATAWASNTTANIAVGQVNNFDSTSNNVHITAIQLEVGEYTSADLPPFRFESYGDNLRRCLRYFEMMADGRQDADAIIALGFVYQTNVISLAYQWHPKRATPSISQASGTNYFRYQRDGGTEDFDSIKIYIPNANTGLIYSDDAFTGTDDENGWVQINNSSAYVALNSEL